jgi:small subunit ribosomal protein S4e
LVLNVLDVISIPKVNEHYRLLFDIKGRYTVHPIKADEAKVFF